MQLILFVNCNACTQGRAVSHASMPLCIAQSGVHVMTRFHVHVMTHSNVHVMTQSGVHVIRIVFVSRQPHSNTGKGQKEQTHQHVYLNNMEAPLHSLYK